LIIILIIQFYGPEGITAFRN